MPEASSKRHKRFCKKYVKNALFHGSCLSKPQSLYSWSKLLNFSTSNSPTISLTGNPGGWTSLNEGINYSFFLIPADVCLCLRLISWDPGRFKSTDSCITLALRITASVCSQCNSARSECNQKIRGREERSKKMQPQQHGKHVPGALYTC